MHPRQIMRDIRALAALYRPTWGDISDAIERSGVPTLHVANGDSGLKDKLRTIEADLSRLREQRVEHVEARNKAREEFAGADSSDPDSEPFKAAESAVRALGECDEQIERLTRAQIGTLNMLGGGQPGAGGSGVDPGRHQERDGGGDSGRAWDSAALFQSEDIRAALTYAATSKQRIGGIELGQVATREAVAEDVALTPDIRRGNWLGVISQLRRPLRVIDLIPTGTMDNNVLPYTVESGTFTSAKPTKEGETKPEAKVKYDDAEAVARTIAHWIKIRKQSLADFSALRSIIDSRLRYGVERVLEDQILAGSGEGENLTGILNTSGLLVVKYEAGALVADQVLKAMVSVLLHDAYADGIVMHPLDWQAVLLAKSKYEASTGVQGGSGEYLGGGPFQVTPQTLWGLPLVPSPAVPQGSPLVGDFSIGAQLFIREGVNVLMSDSDQDDFIKNRVTMLGEMRAALAVFRPAAFATPYLSVAAEKHEVAQEA